MFPKRNLFLFDADNDAGGGTDGGGTPPADPPKEADPPKDVFETFEDFYKDQPKAVQVLINDNKNSVASALKSERDELKALGRVVRKLKGDAKEGSDFQKEIDKLQASLSISETRRDFVEASLTAKVNNPKLAWFIATQDGLLDNEKLQDRKGEIIYDDLFELLKKDYPELFATEKTPPPKGNAGNGAGGDPPDGFSMNQWIRSEAGVN